MKKGKNCHLRLLIESVMVGRKKICAACEGKSCGPAATFTLIIIYRAAFVKPFAGEKKIFILKFYATFIFTLAKDRAVR